MTARLLSLLVVLISYTTALQAQDILQDINRLQALLPNHNLASQTNTISTDQLDTILAVLAVYGQAESGAKDRIRDPQDVLRAYRTNPFIYPLLTRDDVYGPILELEINPNTFQNQIRSFQDSTRQHILERFSASDVYTDDRMLSVSVLKTEYATPPILHKEALQLQANALKEQANNDPASLTTNVLVGLADWITERAQQEFTMTFLAGLQENLEKKNLQYLFPQATNYLKNLDVANYRSIVPNAQQAFAQDLRSLSLNVSNYLYKANKLSESDPTAFNFLLLYRLIDLSQKGVPLTDVLAYARGEMSRRRFAAEQVINLDLGSQSSEVAYTDMQTHYKDAITQMTTTYDLLKEEERRLLAIYGGFRTSTIRDSFPQYYNRIRPLRRELREVKYNKLFEQNGHYLSEAVSLLDGSLDYAQLEIDPTFKVFEQKFLEQNPPPDSTNRAIGLSMTRHLLRTQADTIAVLRSLHDYYSNLRELKSQVYQLQDAVAVANNASQSARQRIVEQAKTQLSQDLSQESDFWQAKPKVMIHDKQSIVYLEKLLANMDRQAKTLSEQEVFIKKIKNLASEQVQYLNQKYPKAGLSPLAQRPIPPEVDSLQHAIEATSLQFVVLKKSLYTVDTTLVRRPLQRSYKNAARYETMLEALSQLMYCLYVPSDSSFINPTRMGALLNNDASRQLFVGLVYQRLSQLPNLGRLDPSGIASISSSLVQSMADYGSAPDSTSTQRIVKKIQFASNAINTVVETPLLLNATSNRAMSLQQVVPAFRRVPPINRELSQLFVRSAQGEYRYAVNNVLNLVDLFNAYPNAQRRLQKLSNRLENKEREFNALSFRADGKQPSANMQTSIQKLNKEIRQLEKRVSRLDTAHYNRFRNNLFLYSHFMADVASAESPQDVQAAIQNIALPKGSSQNKREQWTSVELNAYFGGSIAHERLLDSRLPNKVRPNSYGLFVPVGLSISKRISSRRENSISLFLPLIDLGALTAYRTDPDNQGIQRLPDVTFGNVLAPGAHLFYNFGKSPFFIEMGLQYGPNTREIKLDQELVKVEAVRYMMTFGIDVPILSFSQRR